MHVSGDGGWVPGLALLGFELGVVWTCASSMDVYRASTNSTRKDRGLC